MSLTPFGKFDSEAGDKFEFRVTDENKIYLFHLTNKGELADDRLLKGKTDREKIENGLTNIRDFLRNLSTNEPNIDLIIDELAKARKKME